MPNYNTLASIPIPAIYPGDQYFLFNTEQPAAPQASQQVCLANSPNASSSQSIAIELFFSAAPGAFSIQPQVADTDQDAAYIAEGSPITAVSATNFARLELTAIKAKFLRLQLTSRTNAVNLTAKVTR